MVFSANVRILLFFGILIKFASCICYNKKQYDFRRIFIMKKVVSTVLALSVLATPVGVMASYADEDVVCHEKAETATDVSSDLNIECDVNNVALKCEETANAGKAEKKSSFNEKVLAIKNAVIEKFNKFKQSVKLASYKVVQMGKSVAVKVKRK